MVWAIIFFLVFGFVSFIMFVFMGLNALLCSGDDAYDRDVALYDALEEFKAGVHNKKECARGAQTNNIVDARQQHIHINSVKEGASNGKNKCCKS